MPFITTSGTTGKPKLIFIPPEVEAYRNSRMTDKERGEGFSTLKSIFVDFSPSSVVGMKYVDYAKNNDVKIYFSGPGTIEGTLQLFKNDNIEGLVSTPSGLVNYANASKENYKFKWIMSTTAPLNGNMAKTIISKLGTNLWSVYASSEAGIISMVKAEQIIANEQCVGKIYEGVELRFENDGEIVIKSPSMIKEYADNPELTAKRFIDGWFYTGDLGYMKDGLLYLTRRKS
jgi:acyl-coenzyme A synthetase/AMP-(fatty) acid ligase